MKMRDRAFWGTGRDWRTAAIVIARCCDAGFAGVSKANHGSDR